MYQKYSSWYFTNGHKAAANVTLANKFKDRGYRKGEGRERYTWIGLRLRIFMDSDGNPQGDGSPQEEAGTSAAPHIMQRLTRDDGDGLETHGKSSVVQTTKTVRGRFLDPSPDFT